MPKNTAQTRSLSGIQEGPLKGCNVVAGSVSTKDIGMAATRDGRRFAHGFRDLDLDMGPGKPCDGCEQLCFDETCVLTWRKFEVRRLARWRTPCRTCASFGTCIVSFDTSYSNRSSTITPHAVLADRLVPQSSYSTQRYVPNNCVLGVGQLVSITYHVII